jgi:hypothetical protein
MGGMLEVCIAMATESTNRKPSSLKTSMNNPMYPSLGSNGQSKELSLEEAVRRRGESSI